VVSERRQNVTNVVVGAIVLTIAVLLIWGAYDALRPSHTPTLPATNPTHLTTTTVVVGTPTTQNPSGGPLQPPPCVFEGGHNNC
jgi:TRAP-type C4-dicarboxylate transport system permease small subunit